MDRPLTVNFKLAHSNISSVHAIPATTRYSCCFLNCGSRLLWFHRPNWLSDCKNKSSSHYPAIPATLLYPAPFLSLSNQEPVPTMVELQPATAMTIKQAKTPVMASTSLLPPSPPPPPPPPPSPPSPFPPSPSPPSSPLPSSSLLLPPPLFLSPAS